MGQTEILLEYQRLNDIGDKLETQEYSDEIQEILECIGEKQCQLLNNILLQ